MCCGKIISTTTPSPLKSLGLDENHMTKNSTKNRPLFNPNLVSFFAHLEMLTSPSSFPNNTRTIINHFQEYEDIQTTRSVFPQFQNWWNHPSGSG